MVPVSFQKVPFHTVFSVKVLDTNDTWLVLDTNHCEVIIYKGLSRNINMTIYHKIYKVIMQ